MQEDERTGEAPTPERLAACQQVTERGHARPARTGAALAIAGSASWNRRNGECRGRRRSQLVREHARLSRDLSD